MLVNLFVSQVLGFENPISFPHNSRVVVYNDINVSTNSIRTIEKVPYSKHDNCVILYVYDFSVFKL